MDSVVRTEVQPVPVFYHQLGTILACDTRRLDGRGLGGVCIECNRMGPARFGAWAVSRTQRFVSGGNPGVRNYSIDLYDLGGRASVCSATFKERIAGMRSDHLADHHASGCAYCHERIV